jgi:hemolysin III
MRRSRWRARFILWRQEVSWQATRLWRCIRRRRARFREPTSGLTHLAGAALSLIALIGLIVISWDDVPKLMAVVIFGVTTILIYVASAALHLTYGSPTTLNRLARFDRVSIYVLIAGTYTPICYFFLEGLRRSVVLAVVWTVALVGSLYVILRFRRGVSPTRPMTLTYIAMGALGVLVVPKAMIPTGALLLILAGGLTYLVGSVIYSVDRPHIHRHFNAHDLWHIFVLVGSGFFFAMVFLYVASA